ncbi:organic hydroperoxide resistance protein [Pararhizobium mangrovi]|uniref:Organic hydroperoxide resistance protein n=1 Tax=Pararhizobium mangrovi TaxID=2590452 RepID=A0A506TYP2_9HYPH|nr:organic hydroperoxide resistance protein [Pararhizobium mangrovi]TPW26328.1 organic hydroperoxide resistance protein [Pararhizobium mangrovi]
MTPEKIIYETRVTASGGREGTAKSEDGKLDVRLTVPEAMGGSGGEGTNPEQLFAAGYAACFLGACKLVARQRKTSLPDETAISAKVGIGPVEVGYALTVELVATMPGVAAEEAKAILEGAHERCPYSNATRGNVEVTLSVG